jgi:hypothetical protein
MSSASEEKRDESFVGALATALDHTYSDVFTAKFSREDTLHRKSDRDNNNPHDDVLAPRSTKQRNLVELYLPNVLTHPGILHAFSFWLLVLHAFPHEKP